MAIDPHLRASDADREAVAQQLRDHYTAGRLTLDEFDDRTNVAYAAKTFGDLDGLLDDLPTAPLVPVTPARTPQPTPAPTPGGVDRFRAAVAPFATWIVVSAIVWLIWAGGDHQSLWPLWVMGPWGAMMLMRWLHGGNSRQRAMLEQRQREHEQRRNGTNHHRNDL